MFKKIEIKREEMKKKGEKLIGFPAMISNMCNEESAEILIEALGDNLRMLTSELDGNTLSKPSAYKIVI